jgi:WD40 repeat protein
VAGLTGEQVGLLAARFTDPVVARQVAEAAGIPAVDLPWALSPRVFWTAVAGLIRDGIASGASARLLELAERTPPEGAGAGPAWWVPELTGVEVERPGLADALAGLLLAPAGPAPVGLVAVHGGGGFGKTTLAALVCHRSDVQAGFPDGVLWVEIGQEARGLALAEKINALAVRLGAPVPGPPDPVQAGMRFGEALGERRVLLVVDDVWTARQLEPFLYGGRRCRRLVTTRDQRLLPPRAGLVRVDTMTVAQSRELLVAAAPGLRPADAEVLAGRCGRWPVQLGLVAGYLRRRSADGAPAGTAAAEVTSALDEAGAVAFDEPTWGGGSARAHAVAATVEASLRLLDDADGRSGEAPLERYLELAVFSDDTAIDLAVLETLWGHTAGWGAWQVRKFRDTLVDLSLAQSAGRAGRDGAAWSVAPLQLHNVIHQYLRLRVGGQLPALQRRFLDAYRRRLPSDDGRTAWWELDPAELYIWPHLARHLAAAGLLDELTTLGGDLRWATARIHAAGPVALESDLDLLPDDAGARALTRLVRQTRHLYEPGEPPTLVAATLAAYAAGVPELVGAVARLRSTSWRPPLAPVVVPLPDQPHPALRRTLSGHDGAAVALAAIPGRSWLASGGQDGTVRLWDVQSGAQRAVMLGHTGPVTDLAAAPDGSWLASAGEDASVRLWDLTSNTERSVSTGHIGKIRALVADPGSAWVSSAGEDGTVRIWSAASGVSTASMTDHDGPVWALAIGDGAWLASAGRDGTVRIWDPSNGAERARLTGHDGGVVALAAPPDGSWLASASSDGCIRFWDPSRGIAHRLGVIQVSRDRKTWAGELAAAPDGSWLASSATDGSVGMWDLASRTGQIRPPENLGWLPALAAARDGSWLAAMGSGYARNIWVRLLDPITGDEVAALPGHSGPMFALAAAADGGSWLASSGGHAGDASIRIWETADAAEISTVCDAPLIGAVAVIGARSWVATGSGAGGPGALRLWDADTGRECLALSGQVGPVSPLVVGSDDTWIAAGDNVGDGKPTIRVWDTRSGEVLAALTGHAGHVNALATAPDGSWLASAHGGPSGIPTAGSVWLWDPRSWSPRAILPTQGGPVVELAIASDGSWLAGAKRRDETTSDWALLVWDPKSTALLTTLTVPCGPIYTLAAIPNTGWLAVGGGGGLVRIWNPRSGEKIATLTGHTTAQALVAASDGSWLAAGSVDGTIRIWDLPAGTERLTLATGHGHLRVLATMPGEPEPWLLTAGEDGSARIWDPATGHQHAAIRVDGPLNAGAPIGGNRLALGGFRGLYLLNLDHPAQSNSA